VIILVLITQATLVTNAQAHFLYHHKKMTLEDKIKYFDRGIKHDEDAITWFNKVKNNLTKNPIKRDGFARRVRIQLRWHRAALHWHRLLYSHYQAKWNALHPPVPSHYYAWLCIHRYEGSWTDSGSPFYGGLQMDLEFQRSYGSELLRTKGTAENWTPLEQMAVAERAYQSGRGFYPWPNTARMCGLI
jgi:hypothetical protein